MRKIEVGKLYKHFKNKLYQVVDIVNDCESNNDEKLDQIVIYKALYGEGLTWARNYEDFNSEVDHVKYPDVKQKYRFEEYYRNYETGIKAYYNGKLDLKDKIDKVDIFEIKDSFNDLKVSDIMIVDYDNIDEDTSILMGFAYSNNVPIYAFSKENKFNKVIEKVIKYNEVEEIINSFNEMISDKTIKTNNNTFTK